MAVEEEGLRVFQSVRIKIVSGPASKERKKSFVSHPEYIHDFSRSFFTLKSYQVQLTLMLHRMLRSGKYVKSNAGTMASEAKNLPTYPGPNKMRDCYCTVNLDQEEVFRTKIVEKSLCPFYGEDFYCEIPRTFRHLSFYIFDRDVFRRDSIIGKVAIQKEDLQKYHNRDTWFQLQHVDADSEVQGKVHLELRLSEVITDTGVVCHKLATRLEVVFCKDIIRSQEVFLQEDSVLMRHCFVTV
ncbi:hypothetical protein WISP_138561 [Willisornis vidua]|uniref:C2 domain-containing protein n=1 Tax=Willisornis vidua TaxID=1566151 RepID=A0ABQ9CNL9_9PASS|nr:hypothetical protein WISP_138561 [Willisornis vidua]